MEQVKRQPGTSPMQRVRSPSLWEGGGVACAFGVGTRTRTRTPPASRARGCVTDRLVRVSSRSSRQDQERRGQRAAADVAEVPAVLLAVPAEHGKRVPAGAPASPRPPAARSRPARLPRVRTRPSSRHRAGVTAQTGGQAGRLQDRRSVGGAGAGRRRQCPRGHRAQPMGTDGLSGAEDLSTGGERGSLLPQTSQIKTVQRDVKKTPQLLLKRLRRDFRDNCGFIFLVWHEMNVQ